MNKKSMKNSSHIIAISNDKYSRNWITQIIMRDWRTRIIGDFIDLDGIKSFVNEPGDMRIDGIVIDIDNIVEDFSTILAFIRLTIHHPKIVIVSKKPERKLLKFINDPLVGGYLTKEESEITLAWALCKSQQGILVLSKAIEYLCYEYKTNVDRDCVVFEGVEATNYLTPAEERNARLAFVFSMSRGNIADELLLTPTSSWTLISNLYALLGINDFLEGDNWIQFNMDNNELIASHITLNSKGKFQTNKATAKETLAFHIYTKPKMHRYGRWN